MVAPNTPKAPAATGALEAASRGNGSASDALTKEHNNTMDPTENNVVTLESISAGRYKDVLSDARIQGAVKALMYVRGELCERIARTTVPLWATPEQLAAARGVEDLLADLVDFVDNVPLCSYAGAPAA